MNKLSNLLKYFDNKILIKIEKSENISKFYQVDGINIYTTNKSGKLSFLTTSYDCYNDGEEYMMFSYGLNLRMKDGTLYIPLYDYLKHFIFTPKKKKDTEEVWF